MLANHPWHSFGHGSKARTRIPIPTKIEAEMDGAPTPKWHPIAFEISPKPFISSPARFWQKHRALKAFHLVKTPGKKKNPAVISSF